MENEETSPEQVEALAALALRDPNALAEAISRACPDDVRSDGWTPFSRRLFLQVLAETGRVTLACAYACLTKQSAYALRARDPLFAAGWDAACEIARAPLADALYEKAVDGVTDTITRDGQVVATRHRFDSRLSIAVLHRLDKRCDRAAEAGSPHLALVRNWDQWLKLVGGGDDQAAQALLESARHGQLGQLPLGANPTADDQTEESDEADRCWFEDGVWMTNFAPPAGFDGRQTGTWPCLGYERECTPEEAETLDAGIAAAQADDLAGEEAARAAWFESLRAGLDGSAAGPNAPGS